jgi:type II secretory pathway component GspD/PulD (secretin)
MKTSRVMLFAVPALILRVAAAQEIEVIDLRHRLAEDVIPVLEPLLAPGGALTGLDDKLIVRTSAANLEQVRAALAVIDVEQRQLLVSVGQSSSIEERRAEASASVALGSGSSQVGSERPDGSGSGTAVRLRADAGSGDVRLLGSVRTLEGHETYVAMGQSVPVNTSVVAPGWGQPGVRRTTSYRDVNSGFFATVRLSGEYVTLEISPFQQSRTGGVRSDVQLRSMSTRVSGRLGEWIPLGAVTQSDSGSQSGLLAWGERSAMSSYVAWVKVDEIR